MSLILKSIFWLMVGILFLSSVLPLSKIPHGAVRGLAFPREQFFVITLVMFVLGIVFLDSQPRMYALITLTVVAGIHLAYVVKFTPLWAQQSVDASQAELADKDSHVTILASNVKQSNRDFGALIDLIKAEKPEIATALEVDQEWTDELHAALKDDYAHWVTVPKDNSYGMVLMSKLPLSETQVRELLVEDVPSIRTTVRNADGQEWRLYIVHPEPPVPNHDTKGRDGEIAMIGIEASKDDMPAIVTGDLNDVAWSTTTRRFQRLSGLLDPRVGRGFYNTFHAGIPIMRWPLDHLFHDAEFRLIRLSCLRNIGSDHFPIMFSLALTRTEKAITTPEPSGAEERDEVRELVQDEKEKDREAIGTDWEK